MRYSENSENVMRSHLTAGLDIELNQRKEKVQSRFLPSGVSGLTFSIGLIYLWFGVMKFFPSISPAEVLAQRTIVELSLGLVTAETAIILLAILETLIGIGLICRFELRGVSLLAISHMVCTFTPLLLFPNEIFGAIPFQLTLTGQYILKNIIIASALVHVLRSANRRRSQKI